MMTQRKFVLVSGVAAALSAVIFTAALRMEPERPRRVPPPLPCEEVRVLSPNAALSVAVDYGWKSVPFPSREVRVCATEEDDPYIVVALFQEEPGTEANVTLDHVYEVLWTLFPEWSESDDRVQWGSASERYSDGIMNADCRTPVQYSRSFSGQILNTPKGVLSVSGEVITGVPATYRFVQIIVQRKIPELEWVFRPDLRRDEGMLRFGGIHQPSPTEGVPPTRFSESDLHRLTFAIIGHEFLTPAAVKFDERHG